MSLETGKCLCEVTENELEEHLLYMHVNASLDKISRRYIANMCLILSSENRV